MTYENFENTILQSSLSDWRYTENDSSASYLILSLENEDEPVLNAFHVEGEQGQRSVRKEELIIKEEE